MRLIVRLTLILNDTERQSAQMSKITNDGLTRSGTGCFVDSCIHTATEDVEELSTATVTAGDRYVLILHR